MASPAAVHGLEAYITFAGVDFNSYELSLDDETGESEITGPADYDPTTGLAYKNVIGTITTKGGEAKFAYDPTNRPDLALASGTVVAVVVIKKRSPLQTVSGPAFIKSAKWTGGGREGHGEVTVSFQFNSAPVVA